jgi:Sec-independent protein secretion pathway component TatC
MLFVRVTCPIHLFIQSKAIEPSIHPITRVLVVRVGLASRHLQVVGVVLSYWVGKLSHALLYGYMLLEIIMAYFNVNT